MPEFAESLESEEVATLVTFPAHYNSLVFRVLYPNITHRGCALAPPIYSDNYQ